MVNNKFGQDMVTHSVMVNGPPDPPEVKITSQTTDSVTVKLEQKDMSKKVDGASESKHKTPVHGYTLHYKPEFGDWNTAKVPFGSEEFTMDGLLCGQRYHLYVTAYNR